MKNLSIIIFLIQILRNIDISKGRRNPPYFNALMHRTSFPHPTPDAGHTSRASWPNETSLISGPIALSKPPDLVYLRLMNQTTMTSASISMPFQATFDMACEGVANIWEAHGLISVEAELESSDILSVRYTGESNYNGWPTLSIVFANTNAAKVYTAVWMGMDISKWDVYTDEDVNDYLAHGSFVRG